MPNMKKDWLIIADDLTGAADCAIAFGRRGLRASVGWGNILPADRQRTRIFSYNADSRPLPVAETIVLHDNLLEELWTPQLLLLKKIDSTLRGQPAAEIAVTIDFLKRKTGHAFGIMAPAFPATGRYTRRGRVFIDETELEHTELWKSDHTYPTSDLCAIIRSGAGVPCTLVPLSEVRGDRAALAARLDALEKQGCGIAMLDAETEDDLQRIALAAKRDNPSRFFIGSAGLAHAFASLLPLGNRKRSALSVSPGGNLIAVGSLAYASRHAVEHLIATRDISYFPVSPDMLLRNDAELADFARDLSAILCKGRDAVVVITVEDKPDVSIGSTLAKNLAESLAPLVHCVGGIAATGGETASSLMTAFGIKSIVLFDEVEPGVSLGMTMGKNEIPVATKAGAFGDQYSLVRILDRLHKVRKEGYLG